MPLLTGDFRFSFYHAMLCVSAVFTVARCLSVRPSIHLSRSCILSTAEDIIKLHCRPGSPIILVFFTPGADTQFQGEPLQRECKIQRVCENFAIFD